MKSIKISSHARLVRSTSAAALGVALLVAAQPAFAQDGETASEDEVMETVGDEEMVVTGFRASLESAVNLKRDSAVIAEAFSAEDIGKLPDVSIAETLGRLPGLAVQRVDGRAQSLSVRGLGPDYSSSLLNGRELVSSGDNRGVEYDQYPSELINQGVIYKTPYAGLIGQGLAGTVDLRTIRPLAKSGRIFALGARLEFNEDGSLNPDVEGWGYRATGTYVDQFADDTLGIALGAAYQSSPSQVEKFNAWGYPNDAGFTVLGGMKPFARSVDLDRLGLFGTVEWQPSSEFNTSIDVFYADYREKIPQRGIEFPFNPGWGAGTTITANSGGAFPDSVTLTNVRPVVRNDYDRRDTDTFAAGWNGKYENDDVILSLDVSYSKSDRRLQQIESYSGLGYGAASTLPFDTITYTRNASGFPYTFSNSIDYSNTNLIRLTDPRGWGGGRNIVQTGFINDTRTKDDLWTIRGEVVGKVESGLIEQLVTGFAFNDRTKSRDITQNFLSLAGGTTTDPNLPGAVLSAPIPASALLEPIASLGFLGFGPQVAYNPFALLNDGTYVLTSIESSDLPFPGDWTVDEKVYTGYVRADLRTEIGTLPMTGNVGLQLVFTDQSSSGFDSPGGIGARRTAVTAGDKYSHVLPSINLTFEIADNMKLRLSAARTLARPRMDQLNASTSASISNLPQGALGSIFSAGGGNPRLRPYVADGIDASYEWYFGGGKGYVSLAGYYKELEDFVNPSASIIRDFSYLVPLLSPTQLATFNASGGQTLGFATAPDNGAEGRILGAEATVLLPLEVLTSSLSGFGVQSSVSYTDSKLTVTPTQGNPFDVDVPGLSKWVINSTIFFEQSGFEARLSHRYRTKFLAEFIGISASRNFRETYSESIFDAQIGYRFQEGPLENLSLTLQALNLTDEPFVNFQNGDRAQIIDYERYGRTYLVGASYRF